MRRAVFWIDGDWNYYRKLRLEFESVEELGTAGHWCDQCGFFGSTPPIHEWYGEPAVEQELSEGWQSLPRLSSIGCIQQPPDDWLKVQCATLELVTSQLLERFPIERRWRASGCSRIRPLTLQSHPRGSSVPQNLLLLGLASPTLLLHPVSIATLLPPTTAVAPVYQRGSLFDLSEVLITADAVLADERLCPACLCVDTDASVAAGSKVLWPQDEPLAWLRGTGQLLATPEFVDRLLQVGITGFHVVAEFEVVANM